MVEAMSKSAESRVRRSTVGARTDIGKRRKHNEDAILVREDLGLYVVADGMGGHFAGDVASKLAVETIEQFFEETEMGFEPAPPAEQYRDLDDGGLRLLEAIHRANAVVHATAESMEARRGMGTTVVAAHLTPDGTIRVAHVGDSRCYRLGGVELEQITQDHSFVNNLRWSSPDVSDEDLAGVPKNIITRALGTRATVEVDVRSELTLPGDTYLLCSDGLSGFVSSNEISAILIQASTPQQAADALVDAANAHGGKDNISAIVIHMDDDEDTMPISTSALDLEPPPLQFDVGTGKWRCSRCGHEHVEGTIFCVECGLAFLRSNE